MGKLKAERVKIARGVIIRKLGTTWWLDIHETGPNGKSQRTRVNLGIEDKLEALREARARAADILSRRWSPAIASTLTVESALVEWTQWLRQKRRGERTIENSSRLVGQFVAWLKDNYGVTLLKDITPKHLDDFLDWRAKQPVRKDRITSPTTANNALSRVAAMLSWATKRRYLRENPAVGVERLPANPAVKRVLRRDEIERIAQAASPLMSDLILILANTGCRLGEALALTADDVDLTGSQLLDRDGRRLPNVLVRSTKTRTLRRIPLNAVAINILRRRMLISGGGDRLLFTSATGSPLCRRNVRRDMILAAQKANVDTKGLSPNALRRTFCTQLASQVPALTLQYLAGHADIRTTQRFYTGTVAIVPPIVAS